MRPFIELAALAAAAILISRVWDWLSQVHVVVQ